MTERTYERVIRIAKSQIGYHEGRSNGHWNNQEKYAPQVPGLEWAQGQAWCDVFVNWVALKAGARNLFPVSAGCDLSAADWRKLGRFSEYPVLGGQILYSEGGHFVHTGIVVAYDAHTVTSVEGNTNTNGSAEGDGVYLKVHDRSSSYVGGYGVPRFPDGVVSADPRFAHEHPTKAGAHKPVKPVKPTPPAKPVKPVKPAKPGHVKGAIDEVKAAHAAPNSQRAKTLAKVLRLLCGLRKK